MKQQIVGRKIRNTIKELEKEKSIDYENIN